MTSENPGNQGGTTKEAFEKLVATLHRIYLETYPGIAEVMQRVADAYPGQADQSWVTMRRIQEAIISGNIADYNTARDADPNGKLAPIFGEILVRYSHSVGTQFETLTKYESSYIAEHPENSGTRN